ncbi:unnamed protein product [Fraxinus pennsylvanica]|uniref:Uncharacterized protein n=1 Tax=Fraxinus pennsylvanica TaxID=56036 RepID=A0AAD2DWD3_9LAMI|nr:unnamed protein product [Fraxinus pennsylvanica]
MGNCTIQAREAEDKRTPKGYFVVYVGEKFQRFVIPTSYLKNPKVQKLLQSRRGLWISYSERHRITVRLVNFSSIRKFQRKVIPRYMILFLSLRLSLMLFLELS